VGSFHNKGSLTSSLIKALKSRNHSSTRCGDITALSLANCWGALVEISGCLFKNPYYQSLPGLELVNGDGRPSCLIIICTVSKSSSLVRPKPRFAISCIHSASRVSSFSDRTVGGPDLQPISDLPCSLSDKVVLGMLNVRDASRRDIALVLTKDNAWLIVSLLYFLYFLPTSNCLLILATIEIYFRANKRL